ncbi:DUF2617 family protein [Micromonospora sp. NBC_01813]|uniref:DUF2617 family protein n=1 Tax=Micromonospora sp. NBC_01813 TaxID=2975988 RepID=UPI002DD7DCA0|nr:DUF2617 family protein [Micromonospora sp. NBC_01813]WSA10057.1 DUF2617 family protein [Micromonospora sp. NBC_01813]
MLVTLDAPYVDTTAADLGFALGLAQLPALHVLDLPLPAPLAVGGGPGGAGAPRSGLLRLRLLGASHQAVLRTGDSELVETVACLPGRPRDLPPTVAGPDGYRFAARVRRLPADALAARVGDLRRQLTDDPQALVGIFPGSPDALTALHARFDDGQVSWLTWHSYPQAGELVETETVVTTR